MSPQYRLLAIATLCGLLGACGGHHVRLGQTPSLAVPDSDPRDDRGMYLDLIRRMQDQGAWYASLAHVDAHRQKYGDSPALRLLEADALRESAQPERARALYRDLTSGAEAAAAWHGLGLLAAHDADDNAAADAFSRAVRLAPLETGYLGDLGFALLRAGRIHEARLPLAKAAELAPDDAKAVANLSLWALLDGHAAQAEAMMRRAALPEASRLEVYRLAAALRRPAPAASATPAERTLATATAAGEVDAIPTSSTRAMPLTLMERMHAVDARTSNDRTPP